MKKALAFLFGLVGITALCIITFTLVKVGPRTIVVPDQYPTIQAAIGNATAGDTIFVKKGTYYPPASGDSINIDKPLSLIGEDAQSTVINGDYDKRWRLNWGWITIRVTAPDVTISGFTITNSEISICLAYYSEVNPSNFRIIGNNIEGNVDGIVVEYGSSLIISGNNITKNARDGIQVSSTSTTITANKIIENGVGVAIFSSRNVTVSGNIISRNIRGLNLDWWGPFYIYENNITDNQGCGIQFGRGCHNATVLSNNISRNSIGINLENFLVIGDATIGSGNTVYLNNLIDNSQQAFVEKEYEYHSSDLENGTNIIAWDNGAEGNYWSDYQTKYPNATEIALTGIGDIPYVIDSNNKDNYPLIKAATQH